MPHFARQKGGLCRRELLKPYLNSVVPSGGHGRPIHRLPLARRETNDQPEIVRAEPAIREAADAIWGAKVVPRDIPGPLAARDELTVSRRTTRGL
jgi:hypothetical protein